MFWKRMVIGLCAGGYALSLFLLVIPFAPLVNSPDERANQLFALQFAKTGTLVIPEERNSELGGILGPRSMVATPNGLAPSSFLGLPVFAGLLAALFGSWAVYFLTPIFALCAVFAWFALVKKQAGNTRVALFSALLLALHPGFWYYASRVLMHNIPFLSSLIIAAWFSLNRPIKKEIRGLFLTNEFLAGLFLGAALAFRTSEIIWVGIGAFTIFAYRHFYQERLNWRNGIVFSCGVFLALLPFAYLNVQTYGNAFTTGYTYSPPSIEVNTEETIIPTSKEENSSRLSFLLPFGIHERLIARHAYRYLFLVFPWLGTLSLIAVFYIFFKKGKTSASWRIYLFSLLALSSWLLLLYGSWSINDNPDPRVISLGNSYIRYWLPIFALLTVPIAVLLDDALAILRPRVRGIATVLLFLTIFFLSGNHVFFEDDGIFKTRFALATFSEKQDTVFALTEENAIIITDRSDKFLFPGRSVLVPLREESTYQFIPSLVEKTPLYYFGITLPEEDLRFLEDVELKGSDIRFLHLVTLYDESLYEIRRIEN